jgi:hypothetical protein
MALGMSVVFGPVDFVNSVEIATVDKGGLLGDYVTQDIVIDTSCQWLGAALRVTPDAPGCVFQHSMGAEGPSNPAWWPVWPELEWDTIITNGSLDYGSDPWMIEGAGHYLGGSDEIVFDGDLISIVWASASQFYGELTIARITLLDSASGSWQLCVDSGPAGWWHYYGGPIVNGVMMPEPAALTFLSLGALALVRRRVRT